MPDMAQVTCNNTQPIVLLHFLYVFFLQKKKSLDSTNSMLYTLLPDIV
jgi:hypothetical protein